MSQKDETAELDAQNAHEAEQSQPAPVPSEVLRTLAKDIEVIHQATLSLEARIPESEREGIVYREFLPLLQMLAQKQRQAAEQTMLVARLTEELYNEGFEDEDEEEDEGFDGEGDDTDAGDEGDEFLDDDEFVIPKETYQRICGYLIMQGFTIPSGAPVPEENKSPKITRRALLDLVYSVEPESFLGTVDTLIKSYPTVPLKEEMEQARLEHEAALKAQETPQA